MWGWLGKLIAWGIRHKDAIATGVQVGAQVYQKTRKKKDAPQEADQ